MWELQKALYDTKQGGCVWNKTLHSQMLSWEFQHLDCEPCVYYCHNEKDILIITVHVDDFMMAGSCRAVIRAFKEQVGSVWKFSDLGTTHFCVGITIMHNCSSQLIHLSQSALIDHIIATFRLSNAHPVSTPMEPGLKLSCLIGPSTAEEQQLMDHTPYRSLVGSLMYLAIGTRPDIAFAMHKLCQYLDCYGSVHWEAAKHVV